MCSTKMDIKHKIGLIVMIGLPGSGKTTFINALFQYITARVHEKLKHSIHIIHYDELIPISVQKSDEVGTWKSARKEVLQQVETLVKTLKENTCAEDINTLIFIDDNMYYRSMRYEYFKLARSYKLGFCQFYMSCTKEEAMTNNAKRQSNAVPSEVIIDMATKLQCPDTVHNRWECNTLHITSFNIDYNSAYKLIEVSLNCPTTPISEHVMESNVPSLIHEVDLALRKIIREAMKNACGNKEQLHMLASSLNSSRRDVLEKLRAGDITLPDNLPDFLAQQMDCSINHCSNRTERS